MLHGLQCLNQETEPQQELGNADSDKIGVAPLYLLIDLLVSGVHVQRTVRRIFLKIHPASVLRHKVDPTLRQKVKVVLFPASGVSGQIDFILILCRGDVLKLIDAIMVSHEHQALFSLFVQPILLVLNIQEGLLNACLHCFPPLLFLRFAVIPPGEAALFQKTVLPFLL